MKIYLPRLTNAEELNAAPASKPVDTAPGPRWLDPDVHLLNKPYTQQDLARKVRELIDAGT